MWAYGGFPAGLWPDIKIAKHNYINHARNEQTLADKGYVYKHFFKRAANNHEKLILALHETVNRRLKQFQALSA